MCHATNMYVMQKISELRPASFGKILGSQSTGFGPEPAKIVAKLSLCLHILPGDQQDPGDQQNLGNRRVHEDH